MMHKINILNAVGKILLITVLFGAQSCKNFLANPLIDKETGENINLMVVSAKFVKTRISVQIIDYNTHQNIEDGEIEIVFNGPHADGLIDFYGKRLSEVSTRTGYYQVGIDPSISISPSSPLEFTVYGTGEGLIPLPISVYYLDEGDYYVELPIIRKGSLKTDHTGTGYDEPFALKYKAGTEEECLSQYQYCSFEDTANLISRNGFERKNIYYVESPVNSLQIWATNEQDSKDCSKNEIYWEVIKNKDYGFYFICGDSTHLPPAEPLKLWTMPKGQEAYIYSALSMTGFTYCTSPITLTLLNEEQASGGQLWARIAHPQQRGAVHQFACLIEDFPAVINLIDPTIFPAENHWPILYLEFFPNEPGPSLQKIYELKSPCGSQLTVDLNLPDFEELPEYPENAEACTIILNIDCPGLQMRLGLYQDFFYRIANSDDVWRKSAFKDGKANGVFLVNGEEYNFKFSINGEWHAFKVTADPEQIERLLQEQEPEGLFTVKDITISDGDYKVGYRFSGGKNWVGFPKQLVVEIVGSDGFCNYFKIF